MILHPVDMREGSVCAIIPVVINMFRFVQIINRWRYFCIIIQGYSNLWQPLCYLFYAKEYMLFANNVTTNHLWHNHCLSMIRKKRPSKSLQTLSRMGSNPAATRLYPHPNAIERCRPRASLQCALSNKVFIKKVNQRFQSEQRWCADYI